jgi:hypothetical protein
MLEHFTATVDASPVTQRTMIPLVGTVICPRYRPATPSEVWVELLSPTAVSLHDLLLIESPHQCVIGTVIDMERVAEPAGRDVDSALQRAGDETTFAKLMILSSSDGQQRPPQGTAVRRPTPEEVTELLAEARVIPHDRRVPLATVPLHHGFAPVYGDLHRLVGPIATSALLTGMAGSLKSTAGVLLLTGIQHVTAGRAALVLVNSKGNDFLFADYARQTWARRLSLPSLRPRDEEMYTALGYAEPPVLQQLTAFVPLTGERSWQSARPLAFPRTQGYQLGYAVAIRAASTPTDDEERPASIITCQCIAEAAGPFASERCLTTLPALAAALDEEFVSLLGERARWRNQFQATTVAAALRQLRAAIRDLGPLLAERDHAVRFPVEQLASGGTWVVDVASLPPVAAQAVLDELIMTLWQAKANGTIPHDLPLVLLVDELNRWSTRGPTASRLAEIVRDQRHRRFSLVGLGQQLSTLNPQLLANADTLWLGTTRSRELADDVYDHLPVHLRKELHRLPQGKRVLDAWPLAEPLVVEVPYPSWLIADEGLAVVDAWAARQ